tara:strand:- start:34 stop:153 length:120 start_codon:yes stop_codon:yes gene_type:complete
VAEGVQREPLVVEVQLLVAYLVALAQAVCLAELKLADAP